jgi:hypothetical protein
VSRLGVPDGAKVCDAYVGAPLLALGSAHGGLPSDRFRGTARSGTTARGHTIIALATLTTALVAPGLLGLDDLDTPTDVILLGRRGRVTP